jgi:6-phosphogluconolactonase
MPELMIFHESLFSERAAEKILQKVKGIIKNLGRCSLSLSGGKTPEPVYENLARLSSKALWKNVDFYFGDERCVPLDHEKSNFQMAANALFKKIDTRPDQIHPMYKGQGPPEKSAELYETILPDALDILLLGAGKDGHTASLFPGSKVLDEKARKIMPVTGHKKPKVRLTITPAVIKRAKNIIMLIKGREKAKMVEKALMGQYNPLTLPVQLALDGLWLLDEGAAFMLAP